jgi:hypothetical protein
MSSPARPDELAAELADARAELFAALAAVTPESLLTPGLVGEWSGRELIAHLGYWVGHAGDVIHAVEEGRLDEVGMGEPPTDEVNATVARIARQTALETVRRREAASVEALMHRLQALDASLLEVTLPDGASLADGIREDASEHYREHGAELRRALGGGRHD